jgi:hypothetical protein
VDRGKGAVFLIALHLKETRVPGCDAIDHDGLGGADVHATTSGVCNFAFDDEAS